MSHTLWRICLGASLLAVAVGVTLTVLGMLYAASGNFHPIEGTEEPVALDPVLPGLLLATFGACCLLMVVWRKPGA